ncbi:MAG: N-acetyltransferase [Tissierellia bacterium]|nr:N-acetyltransferase [Tissierellia bacterium]
MIRRLDKTKLDHVMKIWLEANISAHDFILEDYWKDNYNIVKEALPEATVLIYEDQEGIKGFIGIVEESYIAGLFVSDQYKNEGIGSKLVEKCKEDYSMLALDVYAKNVKAIRFYEKHGFRIINKKENADTKENEYSMVWNKLQM